MPSAARSSVKKSTAKKAAQKPVKKKRQIGKKIVKNKPYIELVTALLSIPFLITVTILNFNTLKNLNAQPTPTPENVQNGSQFFAEPIGPASEGTTQTACIKSLGPVSITSPGENDTVSDNPVKISITYDDSEHCAAAWSYRINGGSWSGYDDRSVGLYNLPPGQVTFDLRVKSIAGPEEKTITRKFNYNGRGTVLVPDQNSSGSAN